MCDRAKLHRDGQGATFVGTGGYTGYRLLRIVPNKLDPSLIWVVVKERHQRHAYTRQFQMPLEKWEKLLELAREGAST